jgi:hypothetical protein
MQRILTAVGVALLFNSAHAATTTCPSPNDLVGVYKTVVSPGYEPNTLTVSLGDRANEYQVQLTSYWAPKPYDDGAFGTIGEFSGQLALPKSWSCVALLEVRETNTAEGAIPVTCGLAFRFVGADPVTVYVEPLGQCGYFHGANASPAGRYVRQK